jgi:transposase
VEDQLSLIDYLRERIVSLKKSIFLDERQKHIVELLMSMPGVGRIIALTIMAEIGDIGRFNAPKSLCSWAGD